MPTYSFVTVDVFTDRRFGGNPLAVFPDARGLSRRRHAVAGRRVQSQRDDLRRCRRTIRANTARVRIFNRTSEMPFAGHPNVGTGWVLAGLGRDRDGVLRFEEIAGLVEVRVERDGRQASPAPSPSPPRSRCRSAPKCRSTCWPAVSASTRATSSSAAHRPVVASVGNSFVVAEVTAAALARAAPDMSRFRSAVRGLPALGPRRLPLYLYAHDGKAPARRACVPACSRRCPAPIEDAATGSAATPLAALLLSLDARIRAALRHHAGRRDGPAEPARLLGAARRRRHPRQRRRRLRAGAERRSLAIARTDDEAGAREVDDDVADPRIAALDRDAVRRQADQNARHRHLAGVVRRDADRLAGLQPAGIVGVDARRRRASPPWRSRARRSPSCRWACRCRRPSCAPTRRRSAAAGRAAARPCPRPAAPG